MKLFTFNLDYFKRATLLLTLLLSAINNSFSHPIILLNNKMEVYEPRQEVSFLWDKEKKFSFNDILTSSFQNQFINAGKNAISFGVNDWNMWFRVDVKNSNPKEEKEWMLELNYPHYDSLEFFFKDENGVWQKHLTGDQTPFNTRRVFNKNFAFPITLADTTTRTYYFHVGGEGSRQFPFFIQSRDRFYSNQEKISVIYGGMFFGIILIMIFYNLFIYFSLKDLVYLYYVAFSFSVFVFYLGYSGYGYQYVWGNYPWVNSKLITLMTIFTGFTCLAFSRKFLDIKSYILWLDKLFLITMIIYTGEFVFLWFSNYENTLKTTTLTATFSAFLILISSYWVWMKGNKSARFMVWAFTFYLIGILLLTGNIMGLYGRNFIVAHAMEIGSTIEMTLLSLALSDKYSLIRIEKEKAQTELIEMQRMDKEELEKKVELRTLQINQQKADLQESNRIKDKLLSIISHDLKGPLNAFQALLSMMLKDELTPDKINMYTLHLNNKLGVMVSLVDNILHWVRAQMEGMKFDIQTVKLKDVVKENVNLFVSQAELKEIKIVDEVGEDIIMTADKNVVRLVIRNLLANALKFTENGGQVTILGIQHGDCIRVEIKDTGVGMENDKIRKLFTDAHFTTPDTNQKVGTGLGLLLCKEFLEKISGNIWAESELGNGSTFKFTLPKSTQN